jgi:protein subunit release factor B
MAEKLFSVSIHDMKRQTFRSGGPGGQNQNKRDTGVRLIHEPSGAVGESREHRTQKENEKSAFLKVVNSPSFKYWIHEESKRLTGEQTIQEKVDEQMQDKYLLIEYGVV